MSRRPAQIELVGGKGLRQRIWERLRAATKPACLAELLTGAEIHSEATAREYLAGLTAAGYLRVGQVAITSGCAARRRTALFELAIDAGAEAPRVRRDGTPVTMGLAQEQMWRTLRMLTGDTNARELAAHASTPAVPVAERAAADYLQHLYCAEYLQRTAVGKGTGRGGIPARYRLIRNTGPRPPMVQRTDALYDPNLGAVVWVREINEETGIYGR